LLAAEPWAARAAIGRRCIHARGNSLPDTARVLKNSRSKDNIMRSSGVEVPSLSNGGQFLMSPTRTGVDPLGRTGHTSQQRRMMQDKHLTPEDLLWRLEEAVRMGRVDASVFAAAMQRCGQARWWDALLAVWDLQKQQQIPFSSIQQSICLSALRYSVRGERGFGAVPQRSEQLIRLGRQAWGEAPIPCHNADEVNIMLNAALMLCTVRSGEDCFAWAEELWRWASSLAVDIFPLQYCAYAQVLELHGLTDRVDSILTHMSAMSRHQRAWAPSGMLLSQLVDIAGQRHELHRVRELWGRFVVEFLVQPKLELAILAKAFTLCGHPSDAADALDELLLTDADFGPIPAQDHVQALLIVYHSSLEPRDGQRLQQSLDRGEDVLTSRGTGIQRKNWKQMVDIARDLTRCPELVPFQRVLVQWNAAERSVMARWQPRSAGSRYLSLRVSADSAC